jgi:hypothetical protein
MSIEHLGFIKEGEEDMESGEVKQWKGAMENYSLEGMNGKTKLTVVTDIGEAYVEQFAKIWPKALQKVKQLSEK